MSSMPPPPGGDQSGYQSAPQYNAGPRGPVTTTAPKSMVYAKYAMWAGAVVQLLSTVPSLFMRDQMREIAEDSLRDSGASYDQSAVDMAVNIGLGVGLFMGILGAALWILMAFLTGKGKDWARIVATVLFGVFVVSFLCSFAQPNPPLTMVLNVVLLLIGAAAVFFLWRKDSTEWFKAHKAPSV